MTFFNLIEELLLLKSPRQKTPMASFFPMSTGGLWAWEPDSVSVPRQTKKRKNWRSVGNDPGFGHESRDPLKETTHSLRTSRKQPYDLSITYHGTHFQNQQQAIPDNHSFPKNQQEKQPPQHHQTTPPNQTTPRRPNHPPNPKSTHTHKKKKRKQEHQQQTPPRLAAPARPGAGGASPPPGAARRPGPRPRRWS